MNNTTNMDKSNQLNHQFITANTSLSKWAANKIQWLLLQLSQKIWMLKQHTSLNSPLSPAHLKNAAEK